MPGARRGRCTRRAGEASEDVATGTLPDRLLPAAPLRHQERKPVLLRRAGSFEIVTLDVVATEAVPQLAGFAGWIPGKRADPVDAMVDVTHAAVSDSATETTEQRRGAVSTGDTDVGPARDRDRTRNDERESADEKDPAPWPARCPAASSTAVRHALEAWIEPQRRVAPQGASRWFGDRLIVRLTARGYRRVRRSGRTKDARSSYEPGQHHGAGAGCSSRRTWPQGSSPKRAEPSRGLTPSPATSLARLRRGQGRRVEARDLLAPLHAWFTEGLDTRDLIDAKALLAELRSSARRRQAALPLTLGLPPLVARCTRPRREACPCRAWMWRKRPTPPASPAASARAGSS